METALKKVVTVKTELIDSDETCFIRVLKSIEEVCHIKEQLNDFIIRNSENPYYLYSFIEQFYGSAIKLKEEPLILIGFDNGKIIGIAPLSICQGKTFRIAKFLTGRDFDSDFVVEEKYRNQFIRLIVNFLFNNTGCNFIDFTMPTKTANEAVLKKVNTELGNYHITFPSEGHAVLSIRGTWPQYEKSRGRHFRKSFRSIERKMSLLGEWKVIYKTGKNNLDEISRYILEIEKSSWKQNYRNEKGLMKDEGLFEILTATSNTPLDQGFSWNIAFLEIAGKKIAYSFWYEYKGTAFFSKTSFNDGYKKLYPGVFLNNEVIKDVFARGNVKRIDFMTNLPFHARWNPTVEPRTRIIFSKSRIPIIILKSLENSYILPVRHKIGRITNSILTFSLL